MAKLVFNDRPKVAKELEGREYAELALNGHASQILRGLFLGSKASCGKDLLPCLQEKAITGIVNCTKVVKNFHQDVLKYCNVRINDESGADIGLYFPDTTEFIHEHISQGGAVLVHCEQGISRSSTIVIAYLMRYHGMKRDEAYIKVKSNHPIADPNPGFYQQLKIFEYFLFSSEEGETLLSFVKNNIVSCSDNTAEERFDLKSWSKASSAKFGMMQSPAINTNKFFRGVLDFLNAGHDLEEVLRMALDHVFGRAFDEYDVLWLQCLNKTLISNGYDKTTTIMSKLLSRGSAFLVDWEGEYRPRHMKLLIDALSIQIKIDE